MFSKYRQRRSQYVRLCHMRDLNIELNQVADATLFQEPLNPESQDLRNRWTALREVDVALFDDPIADTPWIYKIIPVK